MTSHDIVVIGAGCSGAVTAFTCASLGARVAIIDDRARYAALKVGESLSGQGLDLLRRAGLYGHALRTGPIDNPGDLVCWGENVSHAKDFIFDAWGGGWHLNRAAFDEALRQVAAGRGAQFYDGRVSSVDRAADGTWRVTWRGGSINGRRVVDASGRQALLARRMGINRTYDPPLIAIHCWGEDVASDRRTVVEARPEGWWYTAPIPGGKRVCALHSTPEMARSLIADAASFAKLVRNTLYISSVFDPQRSLTRLQAVDARGSRLAQWRGRDWIAVGDAAMTFDPLSAHGIVNAMAHAWFGGHALVASLNGADAELAILDGQIDEKRRQYVTDICALYAQEARWDAAFYRERSTPALYGV